MSNTKLVRKKYRDNIIDGQQSAERRLQALEVKSVVGSDIARNVDLDADDGETYRLVVMIVRGEPRLGVAINE